MWVLNTLVWKALSAPAGNGQGLEDVERSGHVAYCQAWDLDCSRRMEIAPWPEGLRKKIPSWISFRFLAVEGLEQLSVFVVL